MRLRKSTGITNGRRPEVRSFFPSLRFTRDRSPKDERERERERIETFRMTTKVECIDLSVRRNDSKERRGETSVNTNE